MSFECLRYFQFFFGFIFMWFIHNPFDLWSAANQKVEWCHYHDLSSRWKNCTLNIYEPCGYKKTDEGVSYLTILWQAITKENWWTLIGCKNGQEGFTFSFSHKNYFSTFAKVKITAVGTLLLAACVSMANATNLNVRWGNPVFCQPTNSKMNLIDVSWDWKGILKNVLVYT